MDLAYYSYLAQAIPKRELARAIAVRARRAIASRLPRPSFFEMLPEQRRARALYALTETRPCLVEPWEREATARLLRERWPQECAAVLREAEAARRGELPVFGALKDCRKPASAGAPALSVAAIDYHRDPLVPSVRYDATVPGARVDLFQRGADAKVMWELGRLTQLWRFGQARWLAQTAAERSAWARAWMDCVRQFAADNPAGKGVQWSCAMEVSARAMHVALTFAYVRDDSQVDALFVAELLDFLEEHCRYVEENLEETGAIRTNHYAADLTGLVVCGALFPELARPRSWARRLWQEIPRQCRPDGTHFESSTGYQRLCAELFLVAVLAAQAGGDPAPAEVRRAVAGLFRSLGALVKPSGEMPQVGDLDSCRGLPLAPRSALDCAFLAPLGALALAEPDLKTGPCPVEAAWLLGAGAVRRFEAAPEVALPRSVLLEDAGVAVLRAGDAWLCLCAGPNGQGGTGGHAHNDKNSVELAHGGVNLIVDRGTFVYARDPAQRNARRGTAGHSTVQVDGLEQNRLVRGRLFALPDTAHARIVRVEERDGYGVAVGEHSGYRAAGLVHRRTASLCSSAAALTDELRGHGEHQLTLRFIVPHEDVEERPATAAERARLQKLHEAGLAFGYDTNRCVAVRSGGEEVALFAFGATLPFSLQLRDCDTSPGYAETIGAKEIALELTGAAPSRLFTAVLFLRAR